MSVNLSPRQLAEPRFPNDVARVLHETGIAADGVWLEITESTLMRDAESALSALGALRALGLHLAVDDFGTGYSSLAYLERLPVEALKIDRSFVAGVGDAQGQHRDRRRDREPGARAAAVDGRRGHREPEQFHGLPRWAARSARATCSVRRGPAEAYGADPIQSMTVRRRATARVA